jgi:hypothetical protein
MLEESVEEGDELHNIFKQVRISIHEQGLDENNFQQLYDEIQRLRQHQEKNAAQSDDIEKKILPKGILSFKNTLFFIEKEIQRSLRYESPFSVITLSVEKIIPDQPIPQGAIDGNQINQFIMDELASILRGSDLVGILTKKVIAVILPMTDNRNGRIALSRLLKCLNSKSFVINDIVLSLKFVGTVTPFDADETPDFTSFIRVTENVHDDFLNRLRNVQDLY